MSHTQWLDKTRQDKQVEVIGCMDGFESVNRVYSDSGLSPTICTYCGGNQEAKILEVKKLEQPILQVSEENKEMCYLTPNNFSHKAGDGTETRKRNVSYIHPALQANCGETQCTYLCETKQIVTMRGRETACLSPKRTEYGKEIRKAYENHEIEEQRKNMQQLEPRTDGLTNTITTVTKDNMLLEIGHYENVVVNDRGFIEKKTQISENICPTLRSETHGNEPKVICVNKIVNGSIEQTDITIRLELDEKFHNFVYDVDGELYLIRIRKLIPKECFKLMGFSDEDFEKAAGVVSNSQLYKICGNSIVKPCLMALFSQLGIGDLPKWNDMTEDERYNLIDQNI